jgi:glycosyltransferase involved in cell wall biosynthesis
MPTVSIIIPTYNREHLLGRAIHSVLAQTYLEFELIIVDDGSTDNTERLVKSFNSEKIKYIQYRENKGIVAARNTGIQSAKGDYIAFLDSDDKWMPEKLERQMRIFEKAPPEVGIVYTGFVIIRNNKKKYVLSGGITSKDGDVFSNLLKGDFVLPSATLVKGECFKRAGMFDERFSPIEDSELFLRMSRYYQFKCINEPLVIYYPQPDSISANKSARIKPYRLILETYFEDLKQDKRILASYYVRLGNLLCCYGELSQGRGYIIRSIKAYPLDIRVLGALLVSLLGKSIYSMVAESYREIMKPL